MKGSSGKVSDGSEGKGKEFGSSDSDVEMYDSVGQRGVTNRQSSRRARTGGD